ncbi:flagellar basal-body rod protein FlgG [Opitutales bacterium ASA1]|jgi:flagellar basal-body rod protein FlgG|uniref:flagellar basal-body rod protein FlgG n=1 Tax=Congregicoccus parvus TaxID=3081749 RepID=UPI002B2E7DA4|nr:flagellar basal-body rod protein FlgG [Opitutales bacterium ASA1]
MNLALYAAASGMEAQQINLNTISNNIANVNTVGFKKSKIEFQDLFYQATRQAGAEAGAGNLVPTSVELGNGSQVVSTAKVFTQGQLSQTGGDLDIAIEGDGFFEVERPDGTSAFTRDGTFKVGADGRVMTSDGYPVLSGFQAIPAGTTGIGISTTGEVSLATPNGVQNFRLQLARFQNSSGLQSIGGNLYVETAASGVPEIGNPAEGGFGTVRQGFVEASNVNVVEEMVGMILAQRAYEVNSKSIQTSDQMLERISQLKR